MSEQVFEVQGGGWARITLDVQQDIVKNESYIKIVNLESKGTYNDGRYFWMTGTITINNQTAASLYLSNNYWCVAYMQSYYYPVTPGGNLATNGFNSQTITVAHQDDGNATINVRVALLNNGNYGEGLGIAGNTSVDLPRIPRVSDISAEPVELNAPMTIEINRIVSNFTDTLVYECGNATGTIATKTSAETISWTPPLSLAEQATTSAVARVKITVTSYTEGVAIGSKSIFVDCLIPSNIVPTASTEITDVSGHLSAYGKYISSKSNVDVSVSFRGAMGSNIVSVSVSCGANRRTGVITGNSTTVRIGVIGSGSATIITTVTDSRGRIATVENVVPVAPYSAPTVTINSAYRCNQDGTPQYDGEYAIVSFSGTASSFSPESGYSDNIPRYYVRYRERGTVAWTSLLVPVPQQSLFRPISVFYIFALNADKPYDCGIYVSDSFNSTNESNYISIPVAFALMDFDRRNQAIGFGQRANIPNTMSIGLHMDLHEHFISNILDPVRDQDAATKTYIDNIAKKIMDVISSSVNIAPVIISNPANYTATVNETVTFSIVASGVDIDYKWQYKTSDGQWLDVSSDISGYNSDTIKLTATSQINGYQYRCVVTDGSERSVVSDSATLTLTFKIIQQPTNVTVNPGDTATFSIVVSGENISYQWQYMLPDATSWENATSATDGYNTNTLRPVGITARNGYQYRCIVSDQTGRSAVSNVVTLIVIGDGVEPLYEGIIN